MPSQKRSPRKQIPRNNSTMLLRAKRLEGTTWQVTPLAGKHFGDVETEEGSALGMTRSLRGIGGLASLLWSGDLYDSIRLPDARMTMFPQPSILRRPN